MSGLAIALTVVGAWLYLQGVVVLLMLLRKGPVAPWQRPIRALIWPVFFMWFAVAWPAKTVATLIAIRLGLVTADEALARIKEPAK